MFFVKNGRLQCCLRAEPRLFDEEHLGMDDGMKIRYSGSIMEYKCGCQAHARFTKRRETPSIVISAEKHSNRKCYHFFSNKYLISLKSGINQTNIHINPTISLA